MKMKTVFNTILLGVGLLASQKGLGQIQSDDVRPNGQPKTITHKAGQPSVVIYDMVNPALVTYQDSKLSSLEHTAIDSVGKEEKLVIHMPQRDKLASYNDSKDYNGVLAPIKMMHDRAQHDIGVVNLSGYAVFIVNREQRHKLTDKLLDDPKALEEFINEKGNVTEIDKNINTAQAQQLMEENMDKGSAIDKTKKTAFVLVGG